MERASRPSLKSRSGCARCKQKRIKCDEERPACQRCVRHRLDCPGYQRPLKWLAKHQHYVQHHSNSRPWSRNLSQTINQTESTSTVSGRAGEGGCTDSETLSSHGSLTHVSPDASEDALPDASLWPSIDTWDFEDLGLFNMPLFGSVATFQALDPGIDSVDLDSTSEINRLWTNPILASSEQQLIHTQGLSSPNRTQLPSDSGDVTRSTADSGRSRFLETYYRLSVPGDFGLSDQEFVNHYFQNVCSIFSCFDSDVNPLRYLVADLYTSSPTIHLAIQSMSIGHLSNYYPQLAPVGLQKRSQAWQLLQRDLYSHRSGKTSTDTVLLSLLLLGLSSSWHQTSNNGMQYLLVARNTVLEYLQGSVSERHMPKFRNVEFVQNALMYWEMQASFIDPVPITPLPGKLDPPKTTQPISSEPIVPHPWSGLSTDVNYAMAEVGRILQRQRAQVRKDCYRDEQFCQSEREWASYLERFLRSILVPTEEDIADYGDSKTPKIDLILTSEAYRMLGLLELYAVFPQLLRENEQKIARILERFGKELKPCVAYKSDLHAWLVSVATHILDLVKPIAISSAACRLLPLVFLGCSSFLAFPDSTSAVSDYRGEQYEAIVQARSLVEARMLVMSRKYPQSPILQMLVIVKEVWQRMDDGDDTAHWMSTMHEKGWQTLMG